MAIFAWLNWTKINNFIHKTKQIISNNMRILIAAIILLIALPSIASSQTILNQNSTSFTVNSTLFQFLPFIGNTSYLNVLWIAQQTGPSLPTIGINCTFTGLSDADCVPKPFVQSSGYGNCVVFNPPYDYYNLNKVSCLVYSVQNPAVRAIFNTSFYPIAFIANTSLSSSSITVGDQIQLLIYVQNIGLFLDNYTVNITSPASYVYISNPLTSTGLVTGNPFNQSAYTSTSIAALAALNPNQQITLFAIINSTVKPVIGQVIPIVFSTGLASLPDFTILGIIQIIILAVLILALTKVRKA